MATRPARRRQAVASLTAPLLLLLLVGTQAHKDDKEDPYNDNGYKRDDSLYDCNTPCPEADFNFNLGVDIVRTTINGAPVKYISRQITGEDKPEDYVLAPTLTIEPGKSFRLKIHNRIDAKESKLLGPPPEDKEAYVFEANPDDGPYSGAKAHGFTFFGTQPTSGANMTITGDDPGLAYNIPHGYDATNIHFHGLTVTPHLFEPIGTWKASAPFIKIQPGECYCYRFDLPEDHPDGTFWYHIHHHGSSSLQSWSGMAGLLIVKGKTDRLLAKYPEEQLQEQPWVLWDPHVVPLVGNGSNSRDWTLVGSKRTARNYVKTGTFLESQNDRDEAFFLINSALAPNFTAVAGQTIRFRLLCATTEALCMFKLVDKDSVPVEFWVFASDGVTQAQAVKRTMILGGGGYRNDVLVQVKEPGNYSFVQEGLSDLQFFGFGPPNLTLATLEVTPAPRDYPPPIDLEGDLIPKLEALAPYKGKEISEEDVQAKREFSFELLGNMSQAPFPQFMVNYMPFNISHISADIQQGSIEEWTLTNPNFTAHPFHIHVYDFQVIHVESNLAEEYPDVAQTPISKQIIDAQTIDVYNTKQGGGGKYWSQFKDVVIVPAYGKVKIRIRFDEVPDRYNIRGKTVFHCHFLPHEDTGMMTSWRINEVPRE